MSPKATSREILKATLRDIETIRDTYVAVAGIGEKQKILWNRYTSNGRRGNVTFQNIEVSGKIAGLHIDISFWNPDWRLRIIGVNTGGRDVVFDSVYRSEDLAMRKAQRHVHDVYRRFLLDRFIVLGGKTEDVRGMNPSRLDLSIAYLEWRRR